MLEKDCEFFFYYSQYYHYTVSRQLIAIWRKSIARSNFIIRKTYYSVKQLAV